MHSAALFMEARQFELSNVPCIVYYSQLTIAASAAGLLLLLMLHNSRRLSCAFRTMLAFLWQLMAALLSLMLSSGVDSWSSYKATACALCCLLLLVCCLKDKVLVSMNASQARGHDGFQSADRSPSSANEANDELCSMSVRKNSVLARTWPVAFNNCWPAPSNLRQVCFAVQVCFGCPVNFTAHLPGQNGLLLQTQFVQYTVAVRQSLRLESKAVLEMHTMQPGLQCFLSLSLPLCCRWLAW